MFEHLLDSYWFKIVFFGAVCLGGNFILSKIFRTVRARKIFSGIFSLTLGITSLLSFLLIVSPRIQVGTRDGIWGMAGGLAIGSSVYLVIIGLMFLFGKNEKYSQVMHYSEDK